MGRVQGVARRAPRVDLRRPAVLIYSDGDELAVIVLDVSSGGFRLQVTETPKIGEIVTLRVEHGEEFPAQIRWTLGGEAGDSFLATVSDNEGEGSQMIEHGNDENDRRVGEDRRTADRRRDGDGSKIPPQGERRRSDRRMTDRRS